MLFLSALLRRLKSLGWLPVSLRSHVTDNVDLLVVHIRPRVFVVFQETVRSSRSIYTRVSSQFDKS